jgi:1-aminocyclopropane-1-carboxylate deaminase/D-cysteine desulfhydrase-like pyridoxal-dependent ACC family enzyme
MLVNGTPIEAYKLAGRKVYVKREDLSCGEPGPPFSKMRGVIEHIAARPEKVFGVLDTYHSKAGWAVAYACKKLHRKCVNFYPVYKADGLTAPLRAPQVRSQKLGAQLCPVPAGRSFILYNQARTQLKELSPGAYLMPNALKLAESIEATAAEVRLARAVMRRIKPAHVVVSVSSGTIAAGVLLGLQQLGLGPKVWLHEGYSREERVLKKYLLNCVPDAAELIDAATVVDEGYAYKDTAPVGSSAPFPCNQWYDLKAWAWLGRQVVSMHGNVLFWNVGD